MTSTLFASYPSLAGRSVIITGGASGIGADIVRHFVRQKSRVAFIDVDAPAARELQQDIAQEPVSEPAFFQADLRDISQLESAFNESVERIGAPSVLVNNAANDERHATSEVTSAYWDERMAVNLKHQFFASKFARAYMLKQGGGSIINLGSTSWRVGTRDVVAYATAKSAVTGLTRTLAREFGVDCIRVNMISPGWIMTERQKRLWLNDEGQKLIYERQCLKEKLMPSDVSRLVLWLAAEDSRLVTGQEFIVDGGWT